MESQEESTRVIQGEERRRTHRKRRVFWKRRQFWIALFSIMVAIMMVLWLISSMGRHRGEVD